MKKINARTNNKCAFIFKGCVEVKELLGRKADNELELLEHIDEVPLDSIYYHTHSYFLRHVYIPGPYPNDFANWVAIQVRDRVLGEKLACVMSAQRKNLEELRIELVDIIDKHLVAIKSVPSVVYGQPFFFMKSKIIEVPTGIRVTSFKAFLKALSQVDASSIYSHIFEARVRVRKGRSDFSIWLEEALGMKALADKIERIDCYMYTLEGLRQKIIELCNHEK